MRPKAVVFDVIGTTLSLEGLRPRLTAVGLPASALETWFAQILREAFALAATGGYAQFSEIALYELAQVARAGGLDVATDRLQEVVDFFSELEPHPDAEEAFQVLRQSGVRIATLTNGSRKATEAILRKAGLLELVEQVLTVEQVRLWKPRREVYLHAAETLQLRPGELALIAAHAWDIHGAKSAGLMAGFVARNETCPSFMAQPDVTGGSLAGVAHQIVQA